MDINIWWPIAKTDSRWPNEY